MKNSQTTALSVLDYNGAKITFLTGEGHVMVNATEMAKSFGKETKDFLKNKQTKEYIAILGQEENYPFEKIVSVKHGGSNPGTWFHELIALRFAQWLSPHFSIWVDKKIKGLLTSGKIEKDNFELDTSEPVKEKKPKKMEYVGFEKIEFIIDKYIDENGFQHKIQVSANSFNADMSSWELVKAKTEQIVKIMAPEPIAMNATNGIIKKKLN